MRDFRKMLVMVLGFAVLSGCSVVYVTRPVGEKPVVAKAADWDGVWVNKNGALTLKVVEEATGRIGAAWVEWGSQGPRLESHEFQLLQSGDTTYASSKETEENGQVLYVWARIRRDGNEIICWIPDADRFKAACGSGQFVCREKGDNLVLEELTPEKLTFLASAEARSLFLWEEPLVLMRVTGGAN